MSSFRSRLCSWSETKAKWYWRACSSGTNRIWSSWRTHTSSPFLDHINLSIQFSTWNCGSLLHTCVCNPSLSVYFQSSCETARGFGCPAGDSSATWVRRPDGTPGNGNASGWEGTLRASGSVPAENGPGPAGKRLWGGETQRPSEVNVGKPVLWQQVDYEMKARTNFLQLATNLLAVKL